MPMTKTLRPQTAIAIFLVVMVASMACKTPQKIVYFQNNAKDTLLQNTVSKNFDLRIKPDDLLSIVIVSASPELSAPFNATQGVGSATSGAVGSGTAPGYLVDKKGTIQFYKLGDVAVTGLTRGELKEKLQKELTPYLKDPVVTVRFLNQRITVLGEVSRPGTVPLVTDQMTVLEALGQSGDLTTYGRRENVLVIRQTEKGKEFRHLNLLDHSIFTSPYYYLQNEDVVYVEPDVKRKTGQNVQTVSYILSAVSILSVLLTRFIK